MTSPYRTPADGWEPPKCDKCGQAVTLRHNRAVAVVLRVEPRPADIGASTLLGGGSAGRLDTTERHSLRGCFVNATVDVSGSLFVQQCDGEGRNQVLVCYAPGRWLEWRDEE